MAYKFNPDKKHHLNTEKRKNEMPPKETLVKMSLKEGNNLLDIGAGIGYFSIPAAKIVGNKGSIFAVDTSQEMLNELEQRVKNLDINNIEIIKGEKYDSDIADNSVDYIFLSNVLHEVEDKNKLLSNYLKKLKPNGKIGIIEFKKKEIPKGPPYEHKISINKLKEYYHNQNLEIFKEVEINDYQYGLVGIKTK